MLPRRLRLSRAAISDSKGGRRFASAHFSVSVRPHGVGCAVVVSKKTERTSVGRHTLKRRIAAAIAPYAKQGYSLVLYTRAGAGALTRRAFTKELTELLSNLPPHSPVR